jgi:N-acetylmuramic acid 6-phosphate etherase
VTGSDPGEPVRSPTEARNPGTVDIDTLPTPRILELLNDEDARVAPAVRDALPYLAAAVDAAVARYEAGGTVHYFGAGTSGRIALLDAAELAPTFSVDPSRIVAHQAGGNEAVWRAVEGAEDDEELGSMAAAAVRAGDVAIGLTASGRTPYVLGALRAAGHAGAMTVLVSSSPEGPIAEVADVHIFVNTGPEAIAGSTRLKAGSAQKMVLNSFSTALMVRLGRTYSNLMIDVERTNAKLQGRILTILREATGASPEACALALQAADGNARTALVSLATGTDVPTAAAALEDADHRTRVAIAALRADGGTSARVGSSGPPASELPMG